MIEPHELRNVNIFAGLPESDRNAIAPLMTPVKLSKGSYLFFRDDESDSLYFVLEGAFQIIIDNEANKEIIVYTIREGGIIGELSLFSNEQRSASVVALRPSRLIKIGYERFIQLLESNASIGANLARILVDRLLTANETIERLGAMDGAERVTHFLRALIVREGNLDDSLYHLDRRPTYYQISQRLGISEKTIYRTMKALAKEGKLSIKGRSLTAEKEFVDATNQ